MILYEGKEYIVINKPNGVYSQGGDGIENHIEKYLSSYLKTGNFNNKGFLVHRLDQYWSGIMILGKNIQYARTFSSMMVQKSISKSYFALCQGIPSILSPKDIKYNDEDNSRFLSGLIRSDQDCTVHDINMINPNISIMNEHMNYLMKECMKLDMFAGKNESEVIDEIANK